MIANYHTHTPRCNHGSGADEEFVQEALRVGLKVLGFADHTPQFYPEGHYSSIRMRPDQLQGYVESLESLKKQYAGQLKIHIGLETEYYPAYFPELISFLRDANIEYLLLGQHYCGNEIGEVYNGNRIDDENHLKRFVHQVADAMQTGLFTYVAHPDFMDFVGDPKAYETHMRWLCREAKANAMPLELNTFGWLCDMCFPQDRFWRIAAEEGNSVIIGSDAHDPEDVCLPEMAEKAEQFAKDLGLNLLETVDLRPIR